MKKLMLASLIFASSQMAIAANWVNVGISSKADNETTYIDLDTFGSVTINNNIYVSAWIKQDYPRIQKLPDGRVFSSEVTLNYFDCNHRKSIIVEQYRYYNGAAIWSAKTHKSLSSSRNWNSAIPNSIGGALLDEVCTSYYIMTQHK